MIFLIGEPRVDYNSNSNNAFTIKDGDILNLETSFIAFPQPHITWFYWSNRSRTNTTLTTNNNMNIVDSSDEAFHNSMLSIQRVDASHTGHFIVLAENYMGQDIRIYTVNVIGM